MFRRDLFQPSHTRPAAFISTRDSADAEYALPCAACAASVSVPYGEIIRRGLDYEHAFGPDASASIAAHFGIGLVGKAHDGGWPAFLRLTCRQCCAAYVLYAGVAEPRNSVFHVTILSVAELGDPDRPG